eukprot:285435_1
MGFKVPANCDVDLDCINGMCYNCLNDGCSEKQKNYIPTCKYGEYDCLDKCAGSNVACGGKDSLSRCRGLNCDGGICIDGPYKRSGTCNNDFDDICTNYVCANGNVVW